MDCQNPKRGLFPGLLNKTKLEGDPETLTFGFMQLFDLMQPQHLRACQYQFGGLDKWAPNLESLEIWKDPAVFQIGIAA